VLKLFNTIETVKNNRGHSDGDSSALGPEPAVAQTDLSPAVTFVYDHLAAQAGAVTISALAAMTGLHQNTVREHLDQLVEVGAAAKTKAASSGRGRPAWLYRAVGSTRTGSSEYLGLASVLAAQIDRTSIDPRADGISAGLEWGRDLAREVTENRAASGMQAQDHTFAEATSPADETLALLEDLGFAPEAVPPEGRSSAESSTAEKASAGKSADSNAHSFRLTRCPLLEAAHEYPDIVCGVHLGLVRGALEVFGDPAAESELDSFSEPGACRLRLSGAVSSDTQP
jgi:predicted ArsR family transcriptional regulator